MLCIRFNGQAKSKLLGYDPDRLDKARQRIGMWLLVYSGDGVPVVMGKHV
jgi:hypothetical protein